MPTEGTDNRPASARLLNEDEPPPFVTRNPDSTRPILLVCDHASRLFPESLGTMGLDPGARRCHLAWDIGAGALTESLAASLEATAVLCQYSRLVIDCNRQLMDPGAFLEFGDGVVISGNRNIQQGDKDRRAEEIYWPYHNAVQHQLERFGSLGIQPIFVAIHSFTPVMNGNYRPCEIGILWDTDRVTAEVFIHDFRDAGYVVGDNEPYSGKAPQDFTIDHHAEAANLPHVGIEIRQDLIHHDYGVEKVAETMHKILETLPARITPTNIEPQNPGRIA